MDITKLYSVVKHNEDWERYYWCEVLETVDSSWWKHHNKLVKLTNYITTEVTIDGLKDIK